MKKRNLLFILVLTLLSSAGCSKEDKIIATKNDFNCSKELLEHAKMYSTYEPNKNIKLNLYGGEYNGSKLSNNSYSLDEPIIILAFDEKNKCEKFEASCGIYPNNCKVEYIPDEQKITVSDEYVGFTLLTNVICTEKECKKEILCNKQKEDVNITQEELDKWIEEVEKLNYPYPKEAYSFLNKLFLSAINGDKIAIRFLESNTDIKVNSVIFSENISLTKAEWKLAMKHCDLK